MSNRPRKQGQGNRRRRPPKPSAANLWRPVPTLAAPQPIVPADEPATLLHSLGDPPLHGQGAVGEHYLAAVVERAAMLATALASSADLLADADADPAEPADG
jgi:hypothetical protein